MRKINYLYFTLVILIMLTGCGIKTDVDQKVVFEDKNLEKLVRTSIGKSEGELHPNDVKMITYINSGDVYISSLKGIEALKNLECLEIPNVKGDALGTIATLKKLNKLNIGNVTTDQLTFLSSCTSLKELYVEKSVIDDLSEIENCTLLKSINFDQCKINSMSGVGKNPSLKKISMTQCQVESVSGCEQSKSVKSIKITESNVKSLTKVGSICQQARRMSIDLSYNQISSIKDISTFFGKAVVNRLNLSHNRLKNLEGIDKIRFSKSPITLNLSDNQLTTIEGIQDAVKVVYSLSLANNQIKDLAPLCTITNTVKLFMNGNPKPYSYNPVAEHKFMYDEIYDEYVRDFDVPKNEIVLDINDTYVKLDQSPVEIKGQDIFISPRYFLYWFGYQFSQNQDGITLKSEKNTIVFKNNGRNMLFNGKSYESPYPSYEKNGVTFVPLKFIVKSLGGTIKETKKNGPRANTYAIKLPAHICE